MNDVPHHDEINPIALDKAGGHYVYWVNRLTVDNLHSKADIASVLAWYRAQLAEVERERDAARDHGVQARLREDAAENARVSMSFSLMKAEARAERLEAALRSAPHAHHCAAHRCVRPMVESNDLCGTHLLMHLIGGPWHEFMPGKCDCFKSVLEE